MRRRQRGTEAALPETRRAHGEDRLPDRFQRRVARAPAWMPTHSPEQ